ncbi:MAG: Trans-aconitate 2-methyltransferase [Flavobacteriaceae bacterium]|nr:MAG: Trans-aconitate 2-methyltransferase [Flavobacteriaceae bacterium]
MIKTRISRTLRAIGLLQAFDRLNFWLEKRKNKSSNETFLKDNPGVVLPPDYLMYESFQLNYHKYYTESVESAKWISDLAAPYINLESIKVLDWGCGPGRVIRHMQTVLNHNCQLYGTDYNKNSINWCKQNLLGISFNHNGIEAELPYSNCEFDLIYGISIFTHLSEEKHHEWFEELYRVLAPNGILILTTQGDNFRIKLTEEEVRKYDEGSLVVRGMVKEGHRTYSAFQPKKFMDQLFKGAQIEAHITREVVSGRALPQDVWIVRKT